MKIEKTGIELIAEERNEQIVKHGRSVQADIKNNRSFQLVIAAKKLLESPGETPYSTKAPIGWDLDIWVNMAFKPYKERLIIAGALIAAEIDRIQNQQP
jgi:hypothetical protein